MSIENKYSITVNTKSRMFRQIPEVIANDNVVFEITVYDDTTLFALSSGYTYQLVSLKLSGQSTIRSGSLSNNVIRFVLGTSEMTEPGKVEATLQIFDSGMKRISTAKFDYVVKKDPSLQGSLPADDTNLVIANESLFLETIQKTDEQKQRVDDLISGTPQPSEVVDSRGGYPVLRDRLNNIDSSLTDIALNVKKYGTKGDGVTDDTQAIRNAITDAQTKNLPLYFPKGNYLYSDDIIFNGITVFGAGIGKTVFISADRSHATFGDTVYMLNFQGSNFSLYGFTVKRKTYKVNNKGYWLVHIQGASNFEVKGLEVTNATSFAICASTSNYGSIHDCFVHDSGADGIHVSGGHDISIYSNSVWNTADDKIAVTAETNDGLGDAYNISIYGNKITSNSRARAILIEGGHNISITGNVINHQSNDSSAIEIWKANGINVSFDTYNIVVSGNSIFSSVNQPGISITRGILGLIISGNIIKGGFRGINFMKLGVTDTSKEIVISENIIRDVSETSIYIDDGTAEGITISNNRCLYSGQNGIRTGATINKLQIANNRVTYNSTNTNGTIGIFTYSDNPMITGNYVEQIGSGGTDIILANNPVGYVLWGNLFNNKTITGTPKLGKMNPQPDSVATDVTGLKSDFNALLSRLRTYGFLE